MIIGGEAESFFLQKRLSIYAQLMARFANSETKLFGVLRFSFDNDNSGGAELQYLCWDGTVFFK